jgi:DNA-binding MarR family transcriptional regulator
VQDLQRELKEERLKSLGERLKQMEIHDLIPKGWITKRQSAEDGRVFRLRLTRRGEAITWSIQQHINNMETHGEPLHQVQSAM